MEYEVYTYGTIIVEAKDEEEAIELAVERMTLNPKDYFDIKIKEVEE